MTIKITESYGNCKECELINNSSYIFETNIKDKKKLKTQVLFINDYSTAEDINNEKILQSNIFREPYNKYINCNDKINSIITNLVLCASDKKITKEIINNCKPNLFKLIDKSKPELIVCLGSTVAEIFDIKLPGGFLKNCYHFFDHNNFKMLLIPSPTFVGHRGGENSKQGDLYNESFLKIRGYFGKKDPDDISELLLDDLNISSIFSDKEEINTTSDNNICNNNNIKEVSEESLILNKQTHDTPVMYKIDDKYYTDNYRLVDIQYINRLDRLVYIFRDKENNKIYYEPPAVSDNYYYYESSGEGKIIESFKNLELIQCNYRDRKRNNKCYESDVNIEVKHAVDYYLQNKSECETYKQNIFFHDIEVYTYDDLSFPTPEKAEHPINLISFCINDEPIQTYVLKIKDQIDNKLEEWLKTYDRKDKITIFNSERIMLQSFIKKMHQLDPDIITAWNVSFDLGYIYNRLDRLGINKNSLSIYDNCFIDSKSHVCLIAGYTVLDMMTLYKNLRQNKEKSYSLENVSQNILGHGKRKFQCTMSEMYEKHIDDFIIYNIQDVNLLLELNEKLRHIEITEELRKTATTTWKGVSSTIGQAEGIFLSNLKRRGLCVKNRKENVSKGPVAGAFVKEPVGGRYEWLVDFDFTSLYPNIVRTWNIGPNTYLLKVEEEIAFKLIYEKDTIDKKEEVDIIWDPIHSGNKIVWTYEKLLKYIDEKKATINLSGCLFIGHEIESSIFYEIYNFLLETRKEYKNQKFQEKDKVKKQILDNKQWALKILANSLYGVLLNEYFRFYNPDLGYSITRSGQEAIKYAGYHLNKYMEKDCYDFEPNFEKLCEDKLDYLLYIDTDSLFLKIGEYIVDKKIANKITIDNILKTVKKLNPILNNKIMKEFSNKHNVFGKYSYLELKQEIIADKAYFLNAKKRYATHIINREGNEEDEMDIKGIETQRSDFSELTKEMLKKILNMILLKDDIDIDEIMEYVEERKIMVKELCIKKHLSIGKPVGFGKPLKEYKTIPRGVRGMLLWNHLIYDYFKPGMKGIEIQISGIEIDKAPEKVKKIWYEKPYIELNKKIKIPIKDIKSIVIPEIEENIPDYFDPDMKSIVSFAVEDRVNLLLEPLFKRSNELLTF